jgi:hypothetical protein
MKNRIKTKRVLLIVLVGFFVGAGAIVGTYVHDGYGLDTFMQRQHELRYCGRCGYREWSKLTRVCGIHGYSHAALAGQKKDFAGIEQASCKHMFFSIGMKDAVFNLSDFNIIRSSVGTLSNDLFFEKSMLVGAYRTLEKENTPADARNVFAELIMGAKFRSGPSTNLTEALKGTNSQALVQALYEYCAEGGRKLERDKRK